MSQLVGANEIEALRTKLVSLRSSFRLHSSSVRSNSSFGSSKDVLDEEFIQQWEELQRLPTYQRSRAFLFDDEDAYNKGKRVIDVSQFGSLDSHLFVEQLLKQIEVDNFRLLQKLRKRIDKAGTKLPRIEVRYNNLCVEAKCKVVEGKPLPSPWNSLKDILSLKHLYFMKQYK